MIAPPLRTHLYLFLILCLGTFLRTYSFGDIPPGIFFDEVAIGVNAKLIASSGLDQYGNSFPILFRALDDYKCPLYIYTLSFLLLFFELDETMVRVPALLFGCSNILAIYFLGKSLYCRRTGLFAALLLSILPWHVHYSRIAWQAITLPLIFTIFLIFAHRTLRDPKNTSPVPTAIFLGLLPYTYSPAKLLFAVCSIALVVLMWQRNSSMKQILTVVGITSLIAMPFIFYYILHHQEVNLRFDSTALSLSEIPVAYISYFSPKFLFLLGDAEIRHNPAGGMCNIWYIALLPLGAYYLVKNRLGANYLLATLALSLPILGAVSINYPHATRVLVITPILALIAALGIRLLLDRGAHRLFLLFCLLLLTGVEIIRWNTYFSWSPEPAELIWNAGQLEALQIANSNRQLQESVFIDPQIHYSAWLFIEPPSRTQLLMNKEALSSNRDQYDFLDKRGKYSFLPIIQREAPSSPGLYVLSNSRLKRDDIHANNITLLYKNKWYSVLRRYD